MANKKLIYTVNLGDYDNTSPVRYPSKGYDYLLFTDNPKTDIPGWTTKVVTLEEDIVRQSRDIKLQIHKHVKGYNQYIYIDGNLTIRKSLSDYAERYFHGGLLLHTHRTRDCLFEEAKTVIKLGVDDRQTVVDQMRRYSMEGMIRRYGLFQNAFLVRDNSVNGFCEKWFEEVKGGSYRDQLSLPYCIWKHKPQISVMHPHHVARYVSGANHKSKTRKIVPGHTDEPRVAPKVWYFTPGRGDKDLGSAYNDHCALVPENDWICIRDGDTMFLNPYWPKQIEDIIIKHGHRFPLISCVTNRLGLQNQLPFGFDEDTNILNHLKRANDLFATKYDEVTATKTETAGLFMLFPKKTWNECKFEKGLTNNGSFVDYTFAFKVRTKLGLIGISQGIYLFHLYRMGKKKTDINHLL